MEQGLYTMTLRKNCEQVVYKGYLITPCQGHWIIQKGGHIISRPPTVEAAKIDIDLITDGDTF